VLLGVVGVAFFALETLFGSPKVGSDEAVVKVVGSDVSGSVLVALCDPVYFLWFILCRCLCGRVHTVNPCPLKAVTVARACVDFRLRICVKHGVTAKALTILLRTGICISFLFTFRLALGCIYTVCHCYW